MEVKENEADKRMKRVESLKVAPLLAHCTPSLTPSQQPVYRCLHPPRNQDFPFPKKHLNFLEPWNAIAHYEHRMGSVQSVSGSSSVTSSDSSSVQTDFQVKQLESQIQDWSTCATTPPETKRAIVSRLQLQLDTLKKGIERQEAVKRANQDSAASGSNLAVDTKPAVAARYVPPFKVDTYA